MLSLASPFYLQTFHNQNQVTKRVALRRLHNERFLLNLNCLSEESSETDMSHIIIYSFWTEFEPKFRHSSVNKKNYVLFYIKIITKKSLLAVAYHAPKCNKKKTVFLFVER